MNSRKQKRDIRKNECGTMKKETVGGWLVSETFKVSDYSVRVYGQCFGSGRLPSVKDKIEAIRSFSVQDRGKEN